MRICRFGNIRKASNDGAVPLPGLPEVHGYRQPVTGRSHQLRIHMRELGHPILGCDMYAHEKALKMAPRLMLHATAIGLEHPTTGKWLSGESPADF